MQKEKKESNKKEKHNKNATEILQREREVEQ